MNAKHDAADDLATLTAVRGCRRGERREPKPDQSATAQPHQPFARHVTRIYRIGRFVNRTATGHERITRFAVGEGTNPGTGVPMCGDAHRSDPKPHPHRAVEEARQEIDAEDRFEATHN